MIISMCHQGQALTQKYFTHAVITGTLNTKGHESGCDSCPFAMR
jgi:hypothetical protein